MKTPRNHKKEWEDRNRDKVRAKNIAWNKENREKMRAASARYAKAHPEKVREFKNAWNRAHPEKARKRTAAWNQKNPNRRKDNNARYREENVGRIREYQVLRRANSKRATPSWANKFFIDEVYRLARMRTKILGFAWHVDHIVPIQHPLVCGLHVEHNLRVIPGTDNRAKGNRHWPDMPT